ncbi:MAG: pyridoxine 5'-phosphate synthase [Verrucomicrobiae bacterium]|nr:pyridoxine 5'-phosphate synthase [Verrucomicrobiae bacterium]
MLRLGVNIDHLATLREARYRGRPWGEPDPVEAALVCEQAGAHGITAHLREDRRHIQDRDVFALRERIRTRLNLEMALSEEMVSIAERVRPDFVCLVPEHRQEITTEGGLDVVAHRTRVAEVCRRMERIGCAVSLFVTPDPEQIAAAAASGSPFIELHTGGFAEARREGAGEEEALMRLVSAAEQARGSGLRVNAGHGLTLENLPVLLSRVPHLEELNIGHSLVSHALTVGLGVAVGAFLERMQGYALGPR